MINYQFKTIINVLRQNATCGLQIWRGGFTCGFQQWEDGLQLLEITMICFLQLPVITDLHNPCLKSQHWGVLEAVVGASLTMEELSLAVLEELNIFSYGQEIQEVMLKYACLSYCSYVSLPNPLTVYLITHA